MPYTETKIISGDIIELIKAYAPRTPGKKIARGKNVKASAEVQRDKNYKNRQLRLNRLINANFTNKDIFLTLSYSDGGLPCSYEAAMRLLKNFLRRLKYHRKKSGLPDLKYIAVTEYKNQRCNHHIVLNSMSLDVIENLWGKGWVNLKRMWSRDDFRGLTNYITKEDKEPNKRGWIPSTNLEQPRIERKIISNPNKELKTPKGYIKIGGDVYATEFGYSEWARYIRINGFDYGFGKKAPSQQKE